MPSAAMRCSMIQAGNRSKGQKNATGIILIYYKFVGYLEIPSHLSAPNYKADLRQGVAVEYVSCEPTESARELFDEECEPVEEEQ